jgi:diacylglycerol kinase (ATP)
VAAVGLDKLRRSFQYALAGLVYALKTQRNVRIHFMAAVIVLGAGLYFRISSRDFVLLFFAITLVFMAELFNTSLEKAVDLFVQEYSHLAKVAKDTAAGAVLVTALNALVVAYVVFYPRLESVVPGAYKDKGSPSCNIDCLFAGVFIDTGREGLEQHG